MQEKTIILEFQNLNKKFNLLANHIKAQEKHIQQIYMIENAVSVTIDAMMKVLVKNGVMTEDEFKHQIEEETKKRQEKRDAPKNAEVSQQPDFGMVSNIQPVTDVVEESIKE